MFGANKRDIERLGSGQTAGGIPPLCPSLLFGRAVWVPFFCHSALRRPKTGPKNFGGLTAIKWLVSIIN